MEIFVNPVVGSRLVPDKLDACSRSVRDPELFPKADRRFAPSPTGPLHVGNLRTALLAWLFARSAGARFLVRVEDLDRSRVRPGVEETQLADLRAIGFDWDGPIVRQSERISLYEEAIARLDSDGHLYPCYCTRAEIRASASAPHGIPAADRYPGTCRKLTATERAEREAAGRSPALRMRARGARVAFEDRLLGRFEEEVDDFVVRRNDGTPSYQLAVTVDDAAQEIGEVVRGADLVDSTPRQLLLAHLLGLPVAPRYAHVPLVLGPDGGAWPNATARSRSPNVASWVRGPGSSSVGWPALWVWPSPGRRQPPPTCSCVSPPTACRSNRPSGFQSRYERHPLRLTTAPEPADSED